MNITIVGAGNIGTQLAVHSAEKGHRVTIFSSKPEVISETLFVVDENNKVIHTGKVDKATSDEKLAFAEAELIFVTMPANLMNLNAYRIETYVRPKTKICLIPGTGGGEWAFKRCVEKGAVLFGIQRVPSVARLIEYGKTVRAIGYRGELFISAIPYVDTRECCEIIDNLIGIKTSPLPNYLNITLTPSNSILHTTRLKNLYADYHDGIVYDNVPLFYEDWNDETSKLLLACDNEVQKICEKLIQFDLSFVKSLRDHYESQTERAMTQKIRSIVGFKGLRSPAINIEGKYIPDFNSRYFTADFPYGLSILVQIAELAKVDVPNMKETLEWYYNLVGNRCEFRFSDYGIYNLEDFVAFYTK